MPPYGCDICGTSFSWHQPGNQVQCWVNPRVRLPAQSQITSNVETSLSPRGSAAKALAWCLPTGLCHPTWVQLHPLQHRHMQRVCGCQPTPARAPRTPRSGMGSRFTLEMCHMPIPHLSCLDDCENVRLSALFNIHSSELGTADFAVHTPRALMALITLTSPTYPLSLGLHLSSVLSPVFPL